VKRFVLAFVSVAIFAALAHGAQEWEWMLRPAEARYVLYGGDIGDTYAPARNDVHVAFYVRGRAAKEMFDAMGPDRKSECGIEKGGRVREKEHVACRFRPSDGYQCDFGFDLRSGKSIGGSIC
jgi:hypothetical protein